MTEGRRQDYWARRASLTEQDWLSCPDPRPMLCFVQGRVSESKVKLFDVACCYRAWDRLDEPTRREVVAWERFAEGEITREELAAQASGGWCDPGDVAWGLAMAGEARPLADLLRCIVGDPFRPAAVAPTWQTPTVASLARAAYDRRTWPAGTLDADRLAALAAALTAAGCTDATVLDHLRGPGAHVRGCWVLGLLLARE